MVEPNKADCVFRTAEANDGKLHFVTGEMNTIMAGLACGEPCTIGWEVLNNCADAFISCPDYAAADGMRILAAPVRGDQPIVSGESGAATTGCVANILLREGLHELREKLASGRLQPRAVHQHRGRHRPRQLPQGGLGRQIFQGIRSVTHRKEASPC